MTKDKLLDYLNQEVILLEKEIKLHPEHSMLWWYYTGKRAALSQEIVDIRYILE